MDGAKDFRNRTGALAALLVSISAVAFGAYSLLHPQPPLARSYADGNYRNTECGTIGLRGGTATFGRTSVKYTLERQKDGVSALTPHLVGVVTDHAGCHVIYDQNSFPLYLSLGRDTPPKAIRLWEIGRNVTHNFVREIDRTEPIRGVGRR